MSDRTVEPLNDRVIEDLFLEEVKCVSTECTEPPKWIVHLCGLCDCRPPVCDTHTKAIEYFLAVCTHETDINCFLCGARVADATTVIMTTRPI